MRGPGVDELDISVAIIAPAAGATLTGPASGNAITISGTATLSGGRVDQNPPIGVVVGIDDQEYQAQVGGLAGRQRSWSVEGRVTRPGLHRISATASTNGVTSAEQAINVTVQDGVPPHEVTVISPSGAQECGISEFGDDIPLKVVAKDHLGVGSVSWQLDGPPVQATHDMADPSLWIGQVFVKALPLGTRTITIRCADEARNETVRTVTIVTKDAQPPRLQISEPGQDRVFVAGANGVTVTVKGTASDGQSGMAGGQSTVEWCLNGRQPYTKAVTVNDYQDWRADVAIADYGSHVIQFRFGDRDGNSGVQLLRLQVVSAYKPKDMEELLSSRAYLEDLLTFTRNHVTTPADGPLSSDKLRDVFHQPFGRLSQPLSAIGDRPLNQLRVAIDVLRQYLSLRPGILAAHWPLDSVAWGWAAVDASGNGNHGTIVGVPAFVNGQRGSKALSLNGRDQYVQVNNTPVLEVGKDNADFAVSFSIYLRQGPAGAWRSIMHKGNNNDERTFALFLAPNSNRLHVRISTTNNANNGIEESAAEIPLNTWTHVAYVKSGNELKLYVNGALDSRAVLEDKTVSNNGPLYLGNSPWQAGFDGALDDVRIYNIALSGTSVRALANGAPGDTLPGTLSAAEAEYRQAAYETLLVGMGTSYEELRLMRGAEPADRQALAERLGIRLSASSPDELERLLLGPAQITEPALEKLFGLVDSTRDPLVPTGKPTVLEWQETRLSARWMQQDHREAGNTGLPPILIDPDLIGPDDLANAVIGDTAFDLLQARQLEVQAYYDGLKQLRNAQATALAGFEKIAADALSGADLLDLAEQKKRGETIGPALQKYHLTYETFAYLVRIYRLAQGGLVTDEEWEDVYQILTQTKKSRAAENWAKAEKLLSLAPDHFKISAVSKKLLPWRATAQARQDWRDLLQTRIDEKRTLATAFDGNVVATEEAALPMLRDALVSAIAGAQVAGDVASWLTEALLLDVKGSGALRTTRILQANETLQTLIFSLRTSRFDASHPAGKWTIDEAEERFDAEWAWMGSYDAWRAAMFVFFYPENFLQPSLRSDKTQAFNALLRSLRSKPRITPEDARKIAGAYLAHYLNTLQQTLPAPLAHWQSYEPGGDVIGDSGSHPSAGKLNGATWDAGQIGTALSFDGLDDTVILSPSPELLALKDTFTIAFWASPQSTHVIPKEEATGGISGASGQRYAWGPKYYAGQNNQIVAAGAGVSVGTNGVSVFEHAAGYLPARLIYEAPIVGWTHVAVVYNERRPQLFLNGRPVRLAQEQSAAGHVYACPDGLGGMSYGYFHGQLDDIRVYDQALSQDQLDLLAFRLTDRRSAEELAGLRNLNQKLLEPYKNPGGLPPYLKDSTPVAWKEIFYFVPIQLALQLQKSGEYVAALDWYQTLYAHDLPPAARKVYYGLELERNAAPDLSRSMHWTRESLNPHLAAILRPNPYTRFTLMSMARCYLEFADAEFTRDTGESLATARALYATARELLDVPELQLADTAGAREPALPNQVLEALRVRAEVHLAKLRQGRNIAGMKRAGGMPSQAAEGPVTIGADGQITAPRSTVLRPTPYYYRVLMERSKQLAGIAQQMEGAFLAALERIDLENYNLKKARFDLELANAGTELQKARVAEVRDAETLATLQQERTAIQQKNYEEWINTGLNEYEDAMVADYATARDIKNQAAGWDYMITSTEALISAAGASVYGAGAAFAGAAAATAIAFNKAATTTNLNNVETAVQIASIRASQARREQDWKFQKSLADKDFVIAGQNIQLAKDRTAVVAQEQTVATTQATQALAMTTFLANKFTNVELYEWMSGVLGGVYSYFLQQATAMAKLAQDQLAFERQNMPPAFILADYWEVPSDGPRTGNGNEQAPDRRGLTGSARLLQDIYQLDQYAFESDKRKLNLAQTFSLARLAPSEFQRFRETGTLPFTTPMQLFDQGFPGHYLRLIKRVRTSVVALIPPAQGIRATLMANGISRVVVGGDVFQEVVVRRDPELVALSSPAGATGVFDLDTQSEMLLPFEAMGVDTTWELQMPKAANPFDYRTIADVLVTMEYTALNSFDYRQQVIQRLDPKVSGERSFSFRDDFPDAWYDLNNPEQHDDSQNPILVTFKTERDDFPPNLEDGTLRTQHVLLFLARPRQQPFKAPLTVGLQLAFTTPDGVVHQEGGEASSANGLYSSRSNASSWLDKITGKTPVGEWRLSLPNTDEMKKRFAEGEIQDILFVITYGGRTPGWPA